MSQCPIPPSYRNAKAQMFGLCIWPNIVQNKRFFCQNSKNSHNHTTFPVYFLHFMPIQILDIIFASMRHILTLSLTYLLLDPSPWLVLSFEMKKEDSLKPYGRIIWGVSLFIILYSFQMQRNRSGSLMEKVALTRP